MFRRASKYSTKVGKYSTEGLNGHRGSKYSTKGVKCSTGGLDMLRRVGNIPHMV